MDTVPSPFGLEDIVLTDLCLKISPPGSDSSMNEFTGTSVESSLIGQISQSNFECSNILAQINSISYTLNEHYQGYRVMDPNVVAESEQHLYFYKNQLTNQIKLSEQIFDQISRQLLDDLVNWLIIQKQVSCGPRATVKSHYDLLDAMDKDFEDCGAQLAFLIDVVNQIYASDASFIMAKESLEQKAVTFVWQSLIVAAQPPAIIVKTQGMDNFRNTKFPCKTEVRLLGGSALGVRNGINHAEVDIVSEEAAKDIKQNSCRSGTDPEMFRLVNSESTFKTGEASSVYSACFENRLVDYAVAKKRGKSGDLSPAEDKKGTRRPKVASLRYYFAYKVHLTGLPYISVEGYKLSLPVAALVHLDLKAEYTRFWDRYFSEGTGILTHVPDSIPWTEMKNALNFKFMSLVQEAQDAKDLEVDLPVPRGLSSQSLEHLGKRLKMERNLVHKKHFFESKIVCQKSQEQAFYEWFHKCGNMVNKYMQKQWNDGLIAGFCSQEESERYLAPCKATMIIRFSDFYNGHIKLSCKKPSGEVLHYDMNSEQLPAKSTIGDVLKDNGTFKDMKRIYPRHPISKLWDTTEIKKETTTKEAAIGIVPHGYSDKTVKLTIKPVADS